MFRPHPDPRGGNAGADRRLMLHAAAPRSNPAGPFTNWTVDVSDNSAKHRIFGKLAPGAVPPDRRE